jgi:hypothetical protein
MVHCSRHVGERGAGDGEASKQGRRFAKDAGNAT